MAAPVAGVKRSFAAAAAAAEQMSPNSRRQRLSGYINMNTAPRIRDSVGDSAGSSPCPQCKSPRGNPQQPAERGVLTG